ncbi:MAG: ribosome biogenesis GTP-binding protein YihA/YsxC [Elusimicrobiota bacterium]
MPKPFGDVRFLLSETDPDKIAPCLAEVAFVGRSNVGKSSLVNAVCGKDVARVSSLPGRTRTITVFQICRDRWLVDMPGYGFVHGNPSIKAGWGPMIEGHLTSRPSLRMVFVVVDAKVGPTALDEQLLVWLRSVSLPWRIVATKVDKVPRSRVAAQRRDVARALGLRAEQIAWVSSETGLGIGELQAEVVSLLGSGG